MRYSIDQLAKLSGVTTRTLRHYDQIGLLPSSTRGSGNVRFYERAELERLQTILFYRELGLTLETIGELLSGDEARRKDRIQTHLERLKTKRDDLDRMIETVARTLEEGSQVKDKDLFHGFKKKMVEDNEAQYGKETRAQYGAAVVEESNRRLMNLSESEMKSQTELAQAILEALRLQTGHVDASSEAGRRLGDMHRRWLAYFWPKVEKDAHMGLARMYIEDERFRAYYDIAAQGASDYLLACIEAYYKG
jgi:DNA-binding transcriptional MerR regulator